MPRAIFPTAHPDPLLGARGYIGQPLNRVDGPLKVTGAARFTAEFAADELAHAALVCSRIASGRVSRHRHGRRRSRARRHRRAHPRQRPAPEGAEPVRRRQTDKRARRATCRSFRTIASAGTASPSPSSSPTRSSRRNMPRRSCLVDYAIEPAHLSFDGLKPEAIVPDRNPRRAARGHRRRSRCRPRDGGGHGRSSLSHALVQPQRDRAARDDGDRGLTAST